MREHGNRRSVILGNFFHVNQRPDITPLTAQKSAKKPIFAENPARESESVLNFSLKFPIDSRELSPHAGAKAWRGPKMILTKH